MYLDTSHIRMTFSDSDGIDHLSSDLHPNTENDQFSPFASPPGCLTPSSSFDSYASSAVGHSEGRRPSTSDSSLSFMASTQGTSLRSSPSPVAQFSTDLFDVVLGSESSVAYRPSDLAMPCIYRCDDASSVSEDFRPALQNCSTSRPQGQATGPRDFAHQTVPQYRPEVIASPEQAFGAGIGPQASLSQSIFLQQQSDGPLTPLTTSWTTPVLQTPPRTVAPCATLQRMLPSSPPLHLIPSMPPPSGDRQSMMAAMGITAQLSSPIHSSDPHLNVKNEYGAQDAQLTSPIHSSDPRLIVKNEYGAQDTQPTMVRNMRRSTVMGASMGRRRSDGGRRRTGGRRSIKESMTHDGIQIPLVAPRAKNACSKGCIQKSGECKKFKRLEHLKRHEKTCHGGRRPFPCWVEGCQTKAFSRSDNLNSHLFKTHGKKSPAARNRYIATLDATSPVYDPNFRGPFTESGWPIQNDWA